MRCCTGLAAEANGIFAERGVRKIPRLIYSKGEGVAAGIIPKALRWVPYAAEQGDGKPRPTSGYLVKRGGADKRFTVSATYVVSHGFASANGN